MQIVIDVSENLYNNLKDLYVIAPHMISKEEMMYAISNGTILPENHGRLIDADELKHVIGQFSHSWEYGQGVSDCWDAILAAPTIIEADKKGD